MDLLTGLILCLSLFLPVRSLSKCDKEFSSKCLCGTILYDNSMQYVVNCTNTNFQNATVLQNLPSKTQILIFTGNNIKELPTNVFGTENDFDDLKVIDMTNNNIQDIRGKSFHRVSKVERLILNHNKISISSKEPNHHHPRIFSSFENLVELHLTDAFADNTPEDLASDLHDIFVNSDLQQLHKLHLEQNEISQFKDPRVFCDLPNLQDLHLGQNKLNGLHFEVDCLPHLRFIDLEYNSFNVLKAEDRKALDNYAASHPQELLIDLKFNAFNQECDSLYSWIKTSKVKVRNADQLKCHEKLSAGMCPLVLTARVPSAPPSRSGTELFLWVALFTALAMLAYTNRKPIEKHMKPLVTALSRKVHYTNLGKLEEQEMNV